MTTIQSVKNRVTITYINEPYKGRPITRIWHGPRHHPNLQIENGGELETSVGGTTVEDRDDEIRALLAWDGEGWAITNQHLQVQVA